MGADRTLRRGRGRWLTDLACISAAGMAGRPRAWAVLIAVCAVAGMLLIGTAGPSLAVSAGLVLAGLHAVRRAPLQPLTRSLLLIGGVIALACLAWALAWTSFGRRDMPPTAESLAGVATIGVCCAIGAGWTDRITRSARVRDRVLLLLALVALVLAVRPSLASSFERPLRGAVVFEVATLLLLARVTWRGPWVAWTLFTAAALTAAQWDVRGYQKEETIILAGPVAVVLAARIAAMLRDRITTGTGDAAAARLSRAVQWHPWRNAIVASLVAFAISLSLWMSVLSVCDGSPLSPSSSRGLELAFFAVPGPFTLVIAVLFHALDREDAFVDRIACAVAPLAAVVLGLGAVFLVSALARGRAVNVDKGVRMILVYSGLGPLLPALTGFVVRRREGRRTRAWPTITTLGCAGLLVVASAGPEYMVRSAIEDLGSGDTLHHVAPLCAIPWLLAFHRLVAADTSLRSMLRGVCALAVATGAGVALLYPDAMYLYTSPRHVYSGGLTVALMVGSATTVIVACMTGLAALGVVLARRLRDVTALPEDHAVLHWAEAMGPAASELRAAQGASQPQPARVPR